MEKYEIEKLRDLPIEGVAERLGLNVSRRKALCPFHSDHHASLSFNVRKNTCRCFVCMDKSLDTIALTMKQKHVDFLVACHWLADQFGISIEGRKPTWTCRSPTKPPSHGANAAPAKGFSSQSHGANAASANGPQTLSQGQNAASANAPLNSSPEPNASSPRFDASRYARFFEHPWLSDEARRFLFEERKLDERVVRWCRISSWQDREGTHWLQTPYFDLQGRLIGVQNRNLDYHRSTSKPRFRFPMGAKCSIYNLPVIGRMKPGDELYITEGCSDCWAMLSAGHKAIAIPSATLLSPKDKQLLCKLSDRLRIQWHMYPDRDAPGESLFLQLKEILPGIEHHQLPPGCKDFGEAYAKGVKP